MKKLLPISLASLIIVGCLSLGSCGGSDYTISPNETTKTYTTSDTTGDVYSLTAGEGTTAGDKTASDGTTIAGNNNENAAGGNDKTDSEGNVVKGTVGTVSLTAKKNKKKTLSKKEQQKYKDKMNDLLDELENAD